jgi:hypothetical protein
MLTSEAMRLFDFGYSFTGVLANIVLEPPPKTGIHPGVRTEFGFTRFIILPRRIFFSG